MSGLRTVLVIAAQAPARPPPPGLLNEQLHRQLHQIALAAGCSPA